MKELRQRLEGAASVGDHLLLGQGHLGERAAVALVGDEDRVVAEADCASPLGNHLTAAFAFSEQANAAVSWLL